MPNIKLTKHDGHHISLPSTSIRAIFSCALTGKTDGRLSVVIADYRGESIHILGQTARSVRDAVDADRKTKKGLLVFKGKPKPWVALACGPDDDSFFEPGTLVGHEGVRYPLVENGEPVERLRVQYRRHTGVVSNEDVEMTEANMATIDADIEGDH